MGLERRDGDGERLHFPDALRAAIAVHGETQRAAARRFGVTPQYVSEWLAGRRVPGPKLTAKVARYLGVTVDDLRAMTAPTYREEILRIEGELTVELSRLRTTIAKVNRRVAAIEDRLRESDA